MKGEDPLGIFPGKLIELAKESISLTSQLTTQRRKAWQSVEIMAGMIQERAVGVRTDEFRDALADKITEMVTERIEEENQAVCHPAPFKSYPAWKHPGLTLRKSHPRHRDAGPKIASRAWPSQPPATGSRRGRSYMGCGLQSANHEAVCRS